MYMILFIINKNAAFNWSEYLENETFRLKGECIILTVEIDVMVDKNKQ